MNTALRQTLTLVLIVALSSCQLFRPVYEEKEERLHYSEQRVIEHEEKIAEIVGDVAPPAVVYVGEIHDQYAYHLNQLAVIKALHRRGQPVAVGFEMIQTPFQAYLDAYSLGEIDFNTMLARTEYFSRWRIDPRLYQPIFEFASAKGLHLLALNAPREITARVSEVGIEGLDPAERSTLPEELIDPDPQYLETLKEVFEKQCVHQLCSRKRSF